MRKPKHIIAGLALTSLLLVGCSKELVASKEGNIVTVTIDNKEIKISAGGLFDDYLQTPAGLKDYYDAVYQVVVRALFEREDQASKRAEAYTEATLKVNLVKEQAKSNSKSGGKYDDELKNILEQEHNVETLKELEEKFAYEWMKTEMNKQFFDGGSGAWAQDAMKELINGERDGAGALVLDDNGNPVYEGYLNNKLPYHVRHLLVKLSAESNSFVSNKISKTEANRLSSVITALAEGVDTFGLLANRFSEDGSAAKYGDLGIMTTSTSYVNEFKLGVYAYDAIYNNDPAITAADRAKLNIPASAKTALENIGLGEIPYGAALKLLEVKDIEKDKDGKEVNDGDALYYPRNIVFNKYFNKHNISVITPNDVADADEVGTLNASFAALARFNDVPGLGKKVLTDENKNPILVVRAGASGSYEGIHFIVVQRSAIVDVVNEISLKDYYTIENPGTANYPLHTYVNFLNLDYSGTQERIDTIKNEVKNFDANINDRIFEKLVEKLDVKFHDTDLKEALDKYLANQYARTQFKQEADLDEQWSKWVEYLDQQQHLRSIRLLDEAYIDEFSEGKDYFDWSKE